jgi:glycosyltransferase involved in cell wall biosynthesis
MNILFYTRRSPYGDRIFGGAESSTKLLAEKLAERGHRIVWLSQSNAVLPYIKKTEMGGISINLLKLAKGSGYSKAIRFLNKQFFLKYLAWVIEKYRIEIVYCYYDLRFLNNILKLRQNRIKVKVVMRMAGMYWYERCLKDRALIKNYESVFNSIDCVNFIHSGLERIVFDGVTELGMTVKFRDSMSGDIGSSTSIGREKNYESLNNAQFTMIMAARFADYAKRQDILVKGLSLMEGNLPVKLTLIGEGSEQSRIMSMISDLNLEDRVEIKPWMKQEMLWQKLQNADLLCHACDYEGLGKTIIESMAIGLPVLASDVAPLNEYIKDGKNGFLVDNNASNWAQKLVSLYHDKEARRRVSEAGIRFIKENYDAGKNVIMYENCFLRLIKNGSK